MDTSILEDIGLTNAEIKVYMALLELGSSSAGPIIEKSKLQSSVVHMTLNKLLDKGFISFTKAGQRRLYQATNPKHIIEFIEGKKERFEEIRNINKEFNVQDETGNKIYPGTGNASNPQTTQYLEAFMKLYPSKELPTFVRKKWSNVKKLLQKKSNHKISGFFEE